MRIKIISDGIPRNTKVVNAETGERIRGVVSVEWKIKDTHSISECKIGFINIPVEVEGIIDESELGEDWAKYNVIRRENN